LGGLELTVSKHNWLVIFSDDSAMLDRRKSHGAKHLVYLSENQKSFKPAGGLRNLPDTPFIGGVWVVNATEKDEVEKLVVNDPYYDVDHRKYDILYWGIAHDSMSAHGV